MAKAQPALQNSKRERPTAFVVFADLSMRLHFKVVKKR
jgi:hypothetical protein